MEALLGHISTVLNTRIYKTSLLTGGDINQVYLLDTQNGAFVLKWNRDKQLLKLFEKEVYGLNLLAQSNSFQIPKVITYNIDDDFSYMLLEYIPSGKATSAFWESFTSSLIRLHSTTHPKFGLEHDNYIGSLVQHNSWCNNLVDFYVTQRLEPQFRSAVQKGFSFKDLDQFYNSISELIPNEPASLIHGDLWNGNYIISESKQPVLIDPAVAYSSREMDLAMMQLFGGFPSQVFSQYHEGFPLQSGWEDRIPLWQLYYLLVHLNIFGVGYYHQVLHVLSKYS